MIPVSMMMPEGKATYALWFLVLALVILNAAVWLYAASAHKQELVVAFLDVGQGDAILIESPTGRQMLVDGGRDRSVLRELPRIMGPFDRSLDVVVGTHPDADHIGGLPGVFERYRVASYLEPGIPHDTSQALALVAAVQAEKGVENALARTGMRIDLGAGAYADILYPDKDVSRGETNDGSIVMKVTYQETCFILSGDAPQEIEDYLVSKGIDMGCEVLKAGHHGSRTSTSDAWLAAVRPAFFVISAGADNSYGHPHEEVLARALVSGAAIVSTAEKGTIRFVSDGTAVEMR